MRVARLRKTPLGYDDLDASGVCYVRCFTGSGVRRIPRWTAYRNGRIVTVVGTLEMAAFIARNQAPPPEETSPVPPDEDPPRHQTISTEEAKALLGTNVSAFLEDIANAAGARCIPSFALVVYDGTTTCIASGGTVELDRRKMQTIAVWVADKIRGILPETNEVRDLSKEHA